MSDLHAQFQKAGEQYAHRLHERAQRDRLAAQAREARQENSAEQFAQWAEGVFTANDAQRDNHRIDTPSPSAAEDLMKQIKNDTQEIN